MTTPEPADEPTADEAPVGRVLCVEDDRAAAALVSAALDCWPGVDLLTAGDLADAARLLANPEQPVDLVLLDLDLPDGTGWDLLGDPAAAQVPVVVISAGLGVPPTGVTVTAQLPKPVMVQDLRTVVARVLRPATAGSAT